MQSDAVRALSTSPRLASAAAALLGAKRVRLYQDCVFVKQPGHGPTNWHSDLNMVKSWYIVIKIDPNMVETLVNCHRNEIVLLHSTTVMT
jgi:hypothetical protein